MKTITLLLDGAGDRSYQALGGKTPLEYANTPNLDRLAASSQCGIMTPLSEGVSLGTDLAHFLLFGYPLNAYPNRAVIDAVGENVELSENTLVLRSSWAWVDPDDDGYMLRSRFAADLDSESIGILTKEVNCELDGFRFTCIHSYDSHGFILVEPAQNTEMSTKAGAGVPSDAISDSDPFYAPQYVMAVEPFEADDNPEAVRTAAAVNSFLIRSHEILSRHPINHRRAQEGKELANFILCKWAGKLRPVDAFEEQNGMSGLLIGKSKLLEGLSRYLSMDYCKYETFEEAVGKALSTECEYVHLHTKDPDEASHKKDPMLKVRSLERIDAQIERLLDFDGLIVVTADHSTPCDGEMIHSGESVPFMARGKYIRCDGVSAFDENACAGGGLRLSASEFMNYVQNATDRGNLYHLRAGRTRRNYRPVRVNRLK